MSIRERASSLRVRIAIGIGGLSACVVAVAFLALQAREQNVRDTLVETHAERTSQLIAAGLEHSMLEGDPTEGYRIVEEMVARLTETPQVLRIAVLNKRGVIRVSSIRNEIGHQLDSSASTCVQCHADEPENRRQFDWIRKGDDEAVLRHVYPIENRPICHECHDAGQSVNGVLVTEYMPYTGAPEEGTGYAMVFAMLVFGGGLTGMAAFFLVDWLVTRPLGRFLERIRRRPETASDGPGARGRDEISRLERAFDGMVESLDEERQLVIRQEKLASLGELAGTVAHEINNPIGIILNQIECLIMEAEEEGMAPQLKEDIQLIRRQARRIEATVSGLLSFSRQAPGTFERVDLTREIMELLSWAEVQYRDAGIHIDFSPASEAPTVSGNPQHLSQVLLNLLNNARDAMPEGGHIRITTAGSQDTPAWASFSVEDEGCGIPEEDRERIFEPFFSTKGQRGTGLGLAICSRIVASHGGHISIKSASGPGTMIEVWLPANPERSEMPAGQDAPLRETLA